MRFSVYVLLIYDRARDFCRSICGVCVAEVGVSRAPSSCSMRLPTSTFWGAKSYFIDANYVTTIPLHAPGFTGTGKPTMFTGQRQLHLRMSTLCQGPTNYATLDVNFSHNCLKPWQNGF